jgi:hypothetical protein
MKRPTVEVLRALSAMHIASRVPNLPQDAAARLRERSETEAFSLFNGLPLRGWLDLMEYLCRERPDDDFSMMVLYALRAAVAFDEHAQEDGS